MIKDGEDRVKKFLIRKAVSIDRIQGGFTINLSLNYLHFFKMTKCTLLTRFLTTLKNQINTLLIKVQKTKILLQGSLLEKL